uniref:Uncharacterized protein LOC102805277 n=1 Tax=Saccoglossus kowalevskii TaxID=10224 RepID=A0ABM0MBS4_SACKO|nr:PREDICTED: uncharacterized protein LOC102805277 [Saccoglossus kowalevskii]
MAHVNVVRVTQSPCNVLTVDENSRVEILELIPSMSAVTACIWARTVEVSGGTPFSYNIAASDNEFFLSFPEDLAIGIRALSTGATGVSINDGAWHHVCVTWNSVGGIWNIYDNSILAVDGSNFRTGLMIRSGGVLILGQEQDTLGGGFDPSQAFKGDLANFNMWDRELDGVDILHSTNDCSCGIEGNVFSWKSDSLDITGTALVSAADFCLIYGIGTDNQLYTRDGINGTWSGPAPNSCCVIAMTILIDNSILGVGDNNQLYNKASLDIPWSGPLLNGGSVIDVTQMSDGTIVGIGMTNELMILTDIQDTWTGPVSNSAAVMSISVLPDQSLLGVGMSGKLWTRPSIQGVWTKVDDNGVVSGISVSRNGIVLGVDTTCGLIERSHYTSQWEGEIENNVCVISVSFGN